MKFGISNEDATCRLGFHDNLALKPLRLYGLAVIAVRRPETGVRHQPKLLYVFDRFGCTASAVLRVRPPPNRASVFAGFTHTELEAIPAGWFSERQELERNTASIERNLELARKRDQIQAGRPPGCWCLGLGGDGQRFLWRSSDSVFSRYCTCPDGQAARQADDEKRNAASRAKGIERETHFRDSLPLHFDRMTLGSYPTTSSEQRTVVARLREWLATQSHNDPDYLPGWLVLVGPYGVGKTCLAIAVAAELLAKGAVEDARFVAVPDLLDRLRHSYSKTANESEADMMHDLRDVEVLVLDDLGAERATDWANERLFVLLNHRHDQHLHTIITTNLSPAEMGQHIGERTMWRVAELAETIRMDGCPNLRQARIGVAPRGAAGEESAA